MSNVDVSVGWSEQRNPGEIEIRQHAGNQAFVLHVPPDQARIIMERLQALLTPEAVEGELVARLQEAIGVCESQLPDGGIHPERGNVIVKARLQLFKDCLAALAPSGVEPPEPGAQPGWILPPIVRPSFTAEEDEEPAPDSPVDVGEKCWANAAELTYALRGNAWMMRQQGWNEERAKATENAADRLESLTKQVQRSEDARRHLLDVKQSVESCCANLQQQVEGHEGAWGELAEHATIRQLRGMQEATIRVDCVTFPLAYPRIKEAIARLKAKGEPPGKAGW